MNNYYYTNEISFKDWDQLYFSKITQFGKRLEIIEKIDLGQDKFKRERIIQLLNSSNLHFKNINPNYITATLRPFFIKENFISVVFSYELNNLLLENIKKDWSNELKNNLTLPNFVIYDEEKPIFSVDDNKSIQLIGEGELLLYKELDIEINLLNIFVNDLID